MATTPNLLLTHIEQGQQQKEITANEAFDELDKAIAGKLSKTVTTADVTLTTAEARYAIIECSGTLTGNRNLIVPTRTKIYAIYNNTSGAFSLTVKTSGGTGVAVTQGTRQLVYCNGTNVVAFDAPPIGTGTVTSAAIADDTIINADINASAAIALSKLATITANRVAVSGAGGVLEAATATKDQVNALAGRTAGRVGFFDGSGLLSDSVNALLNSSGHLQAAIYYFSAVGVSGSFITQGASGSLTIQASTAGGADGDIVVQPSAGRGAYYNYSAGDWVAFGNGAGVSKTIFYQGDRITIGATGLIASTAQVDLQIGAASRIGLIIKGAASQSANLREEQDSSSNILSGRNAKGKELLDGTLTAGGTTGAQTINKPSGSVNFAAAATSLVVTCDQCTPACFVSVSIQTNDATMKSAVAEAASGSFTITPNAVPTGETKVFFKITEIV